MARELVVGPTSHYVYSQRLKLHYVDWGNSEKPLLMLIHGGRDHARSWDWAALNLRRDYHIVAPDLRGHGDSQWAIGSSYALIDYTLDVAQIIDAIGATSLLLVGHSLGGSVALQYAGTYPDRVSKLVAIEGLGPPPSMIRDTPAQQRMRHWIAETQSLARRYPRRYPDIESAIERMRDANPRLTPEQARHLTIHGCYRAEDGTYQWKFDNCVRAASPYLFNMRDARELWGNITCPVLLFRGTESWASDPEVDGRATAFRTYQLVNVPDAGHWVHHDQLDVFLRETRRFLSVG